ncbi:MAG TPA: hypothetical protein VLJ10_00865 [Candidatus Bathyarchaeia archaeon]|nr:hypothetical protein [Candidatus Bathyarchaeia archaeon]
MDRRMLMLVVMMGVLACFTTSATSGMIDHDRLARRRAKLGLVVVQGLVGDIDYRNNEVTIKDSQTSKEFKFVVDSGMIANLSKGKRVDVSFYEGSNVPQSINLVQE